MLKSVGFQKTRHDLATKSQQKGTNKDEEMMCTNHFYHGSFCPDKNARAMAINASGNRCTIHSSLYIHRLFLGIIAFTLPGFRALPERVEESLHPFTVLFIHLIFMKH